MIEVTMPVLGLTMEQGTVVAWLKDVGDQVKEGEALFLVETDKATSEAPSPGSGTLVSVFAGEGETVAVGTIIALIAETAEEFAPKTRAELAPETATEAPRTAVPQKSQSMEQTTFDPARPTVAEGAPPSSPGRHTVFASPRARRRARELGIDVKAVPYQGPRILEHHVLAVSEVRPLTRVRRLIAERMTLSATTIPQVTYRQRCDVTELMETRKSLRSEAARRQVSLPLDLFVARAVCLALPDFPELNSEWVEGLGIRQHPEVHLAVAVDVETVGLLTPVIRNAGSLDFWQTAEELERLVTGAKAKKLGPDDFAGATFTLTSLAVTGVESFDPLVVPPQVAILGVGSPTATPAHGQDQLVRRRFLSLSLTTDHRVLDGTPSARFLNRICNLLERPSALL